MTAQKREQQFSVKQIFNRRWGTYRLLKVNTKFISKTTDMSSALRVSKNEQVVVIRAHKLRQMLNLQIVDNLAL